MMFLLHYHLLVDISTIHSAKESDDAARLSRLGLDVPRRRLVGGADKKARLRGSQMGTPPSGSPVHSKITATDLRVDFLAFDCMVCKDSCESLL